MELELGLETEKDLTFLRHKFLPGNDKTKGILSKKRAEFRICNGWKVGSHDEHEEKNNQSHRFMSVG